METNKDAFVQSVQEKKRKKRIRTIVLLTLFALILCAGGFVLFRILNQPEAATSVLTYRAAAVAEGEIHSTLSGSGTLTALHSKTATAPDDCTVENIYYKTGDRVPAGETVMTLSSLDLKEDLADLKDELETVQKKLASTTKTRSSLSVTASKKGVVKDIRVAAGDLCEDADYLCLISTDGEMTVTLDAVDGMVKYDSVLVQIGEAEEDGYVSGIADGTATVVIDSNKYDYGASATVYDESGSLLGTGTLGVNEHVRVSLSEGRIASVDVAENKSVSAGRRLFTLYDGAPSDTYLEYKEQESDLLERIEDIEDSLIIKAEWDSILATLSVSEGDDVTAGSSLCVLTGTDGYQLALSVDELDISEVQHGQSATVTLDALDGEFSGTVTNISFSGSGSYVTSYTATVTTDPIEGAYAGMSASAEIVTDTSGETMILPVSAINYDGDDAFVYLAADGTKVGESVDAAALALDALEKVSVRTGMSDGNYIAVVSDGLSAGDAVWQTNLATTSVYTDDNDTTTTTFTMGGMPGGNMGGNMGGGNMPGGNMGGGNMPGGMGGNRG